MGKLGVDKMLQGELDKSVNGVYKRSGVQAYSSRKQARSTDVAYVSYRHDAPGIEGFSGPPAISCFKPVVQGKGFYVFRQHSSLVDD